MKYDPEKHNKRSIRLPGYDYAREGAYFITICTKNRECCFGKIDHRKMVPSDIGKIVEEEWIKGPVLRLDMNLKLGEFVVMPNHFHGIIVIGENQYNMRDESARRGAMHCAPTTMHCIPTHGNTAKNQFGPQYKNLASVIRGFKIGVTRNARPIIPSFAWQSGFYDRIIRDKQEYDRIVKYISDNPGNWEKGDLL
ncbi:hypothetical protein IBL28_09440 [Sinomicrobium sp. FJxs]|uniref:Transposase IS200-like domain-containing protein n=2 Tax=Sinomicrobium weinanense TaxID=2842200 RepID=A0A926JRK4_9FLAO|nr:hypothetical protein [Sinomicrobium weinanense]